MLEEEKAYCGKKLERLAMMPDTVVNVAMEVSEYSELKRPRCRGSGTIIP